MKEQTALDLKDSQEQNFSIDNALLFVEKSKLGFFKVNYMFLSKAISVRTSFSGVVFSTVSLQLLCCFL